MSKRKEYLMHKTTVFIYRGKHLNARKCCMRREKPQTCMDQEGIWSIGLEQLVSMSAVQQKEM